MLSEATQQAIRGAILSGAAGYRATAKRYGVSRAQIRKIMVAGANKPAPKLQLPKKGRLPRVHRDALAAATLALPVGTCRWPIGEGVGMHYCGAPVCGGAKHKATHCAEHYSKLFRPAETMK